MGLFDSIKKIFSSSAESTEVEDVSVSITGQHEDDLRKQAAKYYAENKDEIIAQRKAAKSKPKSTESRADFTRKHTQKTLAGFTDAKIKQYVVSTSGDGRVCDACKKQDGKKYDVKDAIIGKNCPPFCDDCRCVILPCFEEIEMQWEKRAKRSNSPQRKKKIK